MNQQILDLIDKLIEEAMEYGQAKETDKSLYIGLCGLTVDKTKDALIRAIESEGK